MKTLIIATLIFLDIIPGGVPYVSDMQRDLESKIKVEEEQVVSSNPPLINFSPLPNKKSNFYAPAVGANAYLAVDMGTSEIILEKGRDESVEVASLTKLMTARLLLKDGNLAKAVTVNDLSKMRVDDSRANLVDGDEIANRDLLKALLINSASDAALTIANSLYSGGYNEFIVKMNEEARALGLKNTNFDNPVGWDSSKNYSSANDLQILARILLKNEEFRKIVSTSTTSFSSEKGYIYPLKNTNVMLDGTTVFGVKTGHTTSAGDCLIALTKVGNRDVLFVILGAGDRFAETRNLLNWTDLVYNW
jgi:D-alanyl-D-alanine carboxypeptidase (penicillin-binding protein 5/6)